MVLRNVCIPRGHSQAAGDSGRGQEERFVSWYKQIISIALELLLEGNGTRTHLKGRELCRPKRQQGRSRHNLHAYVDFSRRGKHRNCVAYGAIIARAPDFGMDSVSTRLSQSSSCPDSVGPSLVYQDRA